MNGTRRWRVVESAGTTIVANPSGRGNIAVPTTMTIAVDVDDQTVLLDVVYNARSHGVVLADLRSERDETGQPRGLPARITRAVAPRILLARVLRETARRVLLVDSEALRFEDVGRISTTAAEALARGRDKSQQAMRMMRAGAVETYAEVTAEGPWPDVYQEVADRLKVGRTTAYRYLRDAGVVGKAKKR